MNFQLQGEGPQIYETVLVPLWFGRWAEALVGTLDLAADARVLDIACGTGVTTRMVHDALGPKGHVAGLDNNEGMLATAAELAEGRDIRWILADVNGSGLPSGSVDVTLSQHGYHYFPDKPAALREFRRLLAPGGAMAFSIWAGHSAYTEALCDAVATHISAEAAAMQRAQRETPTAEALERAARDAGFDAVSVTRQELEIDVPAPEVFVPQHLQSMPIAGAFLALPEDARAALVANVAAAMADQIEGDRMTYADAVHVVAGRA
ncbi:methyltransferase domain-containing protein [uncultured Jannaschia sp.]|uniref:class I SAM-dependent methyltransferase n=1 Tax=uncultured Jannaschia sp. TaxID=293347 RepID=UPI0026381E33|nr:methyltransferase domain-containing protein [uncultured Jannaschia sp.]